MQGSVFIAFCLLCASVVNIAFDNPCLHGGKLVDNRCVCKARFDGPKCEVLKYRIGSGRGFVLSKAVPASDSFRLSYRFLSNDKENGSILVISQPDVKHKAVLALLSTNGNPTLLFNDKETTIEQTCSDDFWYGFSVIQVKDSLMFLMERCYTASKSSTACASFKEVINITGIAFNMTGADICVGHCNSDKFLNNKDKLFGRSLDACIAKLVVNDDLQDFAKTNSSQETSGCGEEACGYNEQEYSICGKNGVCYGKLSREGHVICDCKVGYAKAKDEVFACDVKTSSFTLLSGGYVEWILESANPYYDFFEVQFRTIKTSGNLITMKNKNKASLQLKIENSALLLKVYDKKITFSLDNVSVSDGKWITLRMHRVQQIVSIFLEKNHKGFYRMTWLDNRFETGLSLKTRFIGDQVNGSDDSFEGCMTDTKMKFTSNIFLLKDRNFTVGNVSVTKKYFAPMTTKNVLNDHTCAPYSPEECEKRHPCREDQVNDVRWRVCDCKCPADKVQLSDENQCVFKDVCRQVQLCRDNGMCKNGTLKSCQNNGTCLWNGTSFEDRNYTCACRVGYEGQFCGIALPSAKRAGMPLWAILFLCAILLLLLILLLVLFFMKNRRRRDADAVKVLDERYDVDAVYETTGPDELDGGGEEDFTGEIDFLTLQKPKTSGSAPIITPSLPLQSGDFDSRPLPYDWKNPQMENDDHLDHPLEYGYEGAGSSVDLSSIVSGSTDRDLDLNNLENWGPKFRGLSELYR